MTPTASIRIAGLFSIAFLGAIGGAINAALCYAKIPVAAAVDKNFDWQVIPAGAVHGAILAGVAVGVACLLTGKAVWLRLLTAPFAGWVGGYLSWVPLNPLVFDKPWSKSLSWPIGEATGIGLLFITFLYFGFVTAIYYVCLSLGGLSQRGLGVHLLYACTAGIAGSLWWWIGWKPWYLSLLHGTIWGMLVGYGTWRAVRAAALEDREVTSQRAGAGQ